MTNTSDINFYGLYQVGAESLVEYNTYTLGHSIVPGWKDAGDGDVFEYNHKKFPAKQPGAFFATATSYFFLHFIFGLNFLKNQAVVGSFNAWLSAGLIGAIAIGVFYELLGLLGFSFLISITSSLTFAFATIFFPYTGIPHHDIMATACLIFAFFFLLRGRQSKFREHFRSAGSWLGLTLFFSMLPALLVALLFTYGLTLTKSLNKRVHLGTGFLIGYLPLGLVNAYYFGNPLVQANVAGNYKDTFLKLSITTMKEHFFDYFGFRSYLSATQIMPVFILGIFGIIFIPKRHRKEKTLLFLMLIIHLGYLLNIQTIGHCQFGPRYLIPLIPFTMIGFAGWLNIRGKWTSKLTKALAGITIIYSFAINLLGAFGDTMYCGNLVESAIPKYWRERSSILADHFWLRPYCLALFGLEIIFILWLRNKIPTDRRLSQSH